MRALRRLFNRIIGLMVILLVVGCGGVGYAIRSPFPQINGRFSVPGLHDRVEVYRDNFGVPHIYANNTHDLFFAQGYVQAQDRFWQMEFSRRVGSGRLSELFGASTVNTDRFIRTLGFRRVAEQEVANLDEDSRIVLQAFADGVNAYIGHQQNLGLEFALLKLQGVSYTPEPWQVVDTLVWSKVMAWDLADNMKQELDRLAIFKLLGEQAMNDLFPFQLYDTPVIVPTGVDYDQFDIEPLRAEIHALQYLVNSSEANIGSNNWVIHGSRTDTGQPYLANDPHLGIRMPSIWYEIGLHCNEVGPGCPYDVTGVTFSASPGIIIGHNQRIAWGVTNLKPDTQDLYYERLNPDNGYQYEVNGAWVDVEVIPETILVQGQISEAERASDPYVLYEYDPATDMTRVNIHVRVTRHGPLMGEIISEEDRQNLEVNQGLALRWAASDPEQTFRTFIAINRANTFDDFREALRFYGSPAQNFVYADVDGNIGYVAPGRIPIRANGDGRLPVPGWNDTYEWVGMIPFDELPRAFNPPQGYIATANNAVVGPEYPYLIASDWYYGYRAQRIVDMIENTPLPLTIDDMVAIQSDNFNLSAAEIMPYLANVARFDNSTLNEYHDYLVAWDFQASADSGEAALYHAFWANLIRDVVGDELPPDLWPGTGDRAMVFIRQLLDQPNHHWWDDVTTTDLVEDRDYMLRRAFVEGAAQLRELQGESVNGWSWGAMHTATFSNETFGRSGIAPVEWLFNRGPYEVSGGADIVNATVWRLNYDEATGQFDYTVPWLPGMRMIVDVSNFDASLMVNTTGQSGHPFNPHYADMIDMWRFFEYHPQWWNRVSVEADAESHLTLLP